MINALGDEQPIARRAWEEGRSHLAVVGGRDSRENFLLEVTFELILNRDGVSTVAQECLCSGGGESRQAAFQAPAADLGPEVSLSISPESTENCKSVIVLEPRYNCLFSTSIPPCLDLRPPTSGQVDLAGLLAGSWASQPKPEVRASSGGLADISSLKPFFPAQLLSGNNKGPQLWEKAMQGTIVSDSLHPSFMWLRETIAGQQWGRVGGGGGHIILHEIVHWAAPKLHSGELGSNIPGCAIHRHEPGHIIQPFLCFLPLFPNFCPEAVGCC